MIVAGCSANNQPLSLNDEIRRTYVDELKILTVDGRFAVARSSTQILEFERNKSDSWDIRLRLPIAEDWIDQSISGFSTYVDEERLRLAYVAYLRLVEGNDVTDSPLSKKSPLPLAPSRRCNLSAEYAAYAGTPRAIDRTANGAGVFAVHCLGSDGRYAFFVVTGLSRGTPFDSLCFNIECYPRLVILRADNGKDWKVYDEGVIQNRGIQTWE
jgi:hypothetical protein